MRVTSSNKKALRDALRKRRRALSPEHQARAARSLLDSVVEISGWADAQRVALYAPFDGEIATDGLAALARRSDKAVYLPVIGEDQSLQFTAWTTEAPMDKNRYGIDEPQLDTARSASDMDIIFVPMVGFDLRGNRLGMGGGYYDRALAHVSGVTLVGLAHTCQQVQAVTPDAWDVAMDFIATDTALHVIRNQRG